MNKFNTICQILIDLVFLAIEIISIFVYYRSGKPLRVYLLRQTVTFYLTSIFIHPNLMVEVN